MTTVVNVSKTKMVEKRWLNLQESAKYIGVSVKTMTRLRDAGALHSYHPLERLWLFEVSDLDRLIIKSKVI